MKDKEGVVKAVKKTEVSSAKADSKSPAKRPEEVDRKKRAVSQEKLSKKTVEKEDNGAQIPPPRR